MGSVPLPDFSQLTISGISEPEPELLSPDSQAHSSSQASPLDGLSLHDRAAHQRVPGGREQTGEEDRNGSDSTPTADDLDYHTLSYSQASKIEDFFRPAARAIGVVLVRYRIAIDKWEQAEETDLTIAKGSIFVDQCLQRVVFVLERVKTVLEMLLKLSSSLDKFRVELHPAMLDPKEEQAVNLFWHALNGLADTSTLLEDGLKDVTIQFGEISEWLDECLTPALAELLPPTADGSQEVDRILDDHSGLCEATTQTTRALQVMSDCATKIRLSVQSFNHRLYGIGKPLDVSALQKWAESWNGCLRSLSRSLTYLIGISDYIQSTTSGTPHAITI